MLEEVHHPLPSQKTKKTLKKHQGRTSKLHTGRPKTILILNLRNVRQTPWLLGHILPHYKIQETTPLFSHSTFQKVLQKSHKNSSQKKKKGEKKQRPSVELIIWCLLNWGLVSFNDFLTSRMVSYWLSVFFLQIKLTFQSGHWKAKYKAMGCSLNWALVK